MLQQFSGQSAVALEFLTRFVLLCVHPVAAGVCLVFCA